MCIRDRIRSLDRLRRPAVSNGIAIIQEPKGMKELLTYLTKHILPHAEDIEILEACNETGDVSFTLYTNPEDTGIAIGKGGKTAHALRELLKVKAMQTGQRVSLTIKSTDEKVE